MWFISFYSFVILDCNSSAEFYSISERNRGYIFFPPHVTPICAYSSPEPRFHSTIIVIISFLALMLSSPRAFSAFCVATMPPSPRFLVGGEATKARVRFPRTARGFNGTLDSPLAGAGCEHVLTVWDFAFRFFFFVFSLFLSFFLLL